MAYQPDRAFRCILRFDEGWLTRRLSSMEHLAYFRANGEDETTPKIKTELASLSSSKVEKYEDVSAH